MEKNKAKENGGDGFATVGTSSLTIFTKNASEKNDGFGYSDGTRGSKPCGPRPNR